MSLLHTFLGQPPTETITKAFGNVLVTLDGRELEDYSCGITGHSIIGWGNIQVAEKAKQQLIDIGHIDYKTFLDINREALAKELASISRSSLSHLFFVGGSGGESCEACIKLSYQAHVNSGESDRTVYVSRRQSYHGMSSDNLSLGDRANLEIYSVFHPANRYKVDEHNYYRHALSGESSSDYAARSCTQFRKQLLDIGVERIGGVVIETMMGGLVGDVPPSQGYLPGISQICKELGIHLILDEVWCGNGVSGRYFCHDWYDIEPDFCFFGKTLAAGYAPISALMTTNDIRSRLQCKDSRINYSTTFQGHSLCVAIALEVFSIIQRDNLIERSDQIGAHIRSRVSLELQNSRFYANVRGLGIRNSVENSCPQSHMFSIELGNRLKDLGYVLSSKWHRTSILPPMNISMQRLDNFLDTFVEQWLLLESDWHSLNIDSIRSKPFF